MEKIAVLGSGSWGTALACVAGGACPQVSLWGRDPEAADRIQSSRVNERFLPGVELPSGVTATADLEGAVRGAGAVLVVVPSKAVRETAEAVAACGGLGGDAVLVSCSKGIENGSGLRMSEVIAAALPDNPSAVLSGPNHAEEIAARQAAAAVIGSGAEGVAERLQATLAQPWFRTYTSRDVAGIEWAGAVKNVFAIAAGIADGLGLGDNAKAALVTRGLAEMVRIGTAHGGRRETFQGLSGVGDLIATCYSRHSRNNRFGNQLGKGASVEEATASLAMVAEGVPNTLSIYGAARRSDVRTPLIDAVYAVLYEGKAPIQGLQELLARDPRPEED